MKTVARPYAKALFSLAQENKTVSDWSVRLNFLAEIIQELNKNKNINNINNHNIKKLILLLLTETKLINVEIINLINLLDYYDKLMLLPYINELFEKDKFLCEQIIQVKIISAFDLLPNIKEKFKQSLERRLKKQVSLEYSLDKALIGGAMICAGDWVIDGSIRAKLVKLKEEIL